MDLEILSVPDKLLSNLPALWTFILFVVRYGGLLLTVPGLGMGLSGILVRYPAIAVLSFASLLGCQNYTPLPNLWFDVGIQVFNEFSYGLLLGFIPQIIIAGVQLGAQISSTTMGLQAASLFDPTSQAQVSDLSRIFGDITVILFLLIGGHHVVVQAAAGMGGEMQPGSFIFGANSLDVLVEKVGHTFEIGVMVSAPVVTALLLTNLVMGLISKAVPTVNIFIVSFPLTIGIGLMLAMLMVPDLIAYASRELSTVEQGVLQVSADHR